MIDNKDDCIVTPKWLASERNLNGNEKLLYSIYYYYTTKGKLGCCKIINEELASIIGVTVRQLKRYKKHLTDLEYIKTNGGIAVKAIKNE